MPTESDFFSADQAEVWVQPDGPNTTVYLLPCANTDAIDAPGPDVTTRMCRTADGWRVSHRGRGVPGPTTMTIDTYMSAVQSWLSKQKERGCQMPVYVTHGACPNATFLNFDVADMMRGGLITSKGGSGWARGRSDAGDGAADASMRSYDLSGWPEAPEVYPLVLTRRTIAEAEQLYDIDFCNTPMCLGPCGVTEDACIDGIITAYFTTVGTTDVWFTTNGWLTGAASVLPPFTAVNDEAATAAVCFPIDRDTVRHIVGRGTTSAVAAPAEIGYTDTGGAAATWQQTAMPGPNGEFFQWGGSIWAINQRNIWAGTDQGSIYFSNDAGLTFTAQGTPAGVNAIYSIHFIDENYGMAVGAANAFSYTVDGGEHWTAGTGGGAGIITGVRVIDAYRAWACNADGTLWYTNDFGTNWYQRALPQVPDALGAIDLLDEYVISTVGFQTYGTELPIIYRTFNGGMDWEYYRYTTAFDSGATYGLNAVKICSYNHIFAVGQPIASTGVILELQNAQPS